MNDKGLRPWIEGGDGRHPANRIIRSYWRLINSLKHDMTIFNDPLGLPAQALFFSYLTAWTLGDLIHFVINSLIEDMRLTQPQHRNSP